MTVPREDGLVSLVYLVCLVCLVEPDRPDRLDEPDQPSPVSLVPLVTRGYSAACYELDFRAVASDSTIPSQEFWSFSTNRLAACSNDTTRSVFGAPS